MRHQIRFGSRSIDFSLEYRERKTLGVKVHPDESVEVLAPLSAREIDVLEKVKLKAPWILKQKDHFSSYKPKTSPRRFINGETHLYLGRQYRLKVVADKNDIIKAYRGQIVMYANDRRPEALKKQLDEWYRARAFVVFNELMQELLPRFKKYKIIHPSLSVRFMSKRWGSCTSSGKITLNTELIKAPKGCIEYVIIHELCHLVHYNHTRDFQNLLNRMMPDWQKWKDRLEKTMY